jgi:hypothetical protein
MGTRLAAVVENIKTQIYILQFTAVAHVLKENVLSKWNWMAGGKA